MARQRSKSKSASSPVAEPVVPATTTTNEKPSTSAAAVTAASATEAPVMNHSIWKEKRIEGGRLFTGPTVFSNDSK